MKVGGVSGAVLLLALMTASAPAGTASPEPRSTEAAAPAPVFSRSVLTADDSRYRFTRHPGGRVVIRAPQANPDSNRRELFSRPTARVSRDQTTCATWVDETDALVQEGLAVRIVDRGRQVRAITLTKNTVFHIDWVFNVVTWNTARDGDPWRDVEQFDMGSALGTPELGVEPFPWRVCLRATGRTVGFKVWLPGSMAEPSWQNATYARSTKLPARFNVVGTPGWYVGHVPAGGKVVYADLTTR